MYERPHGQAGKAYRFTFLVIGVIVFWLAIGILALTH